MNRFITLLLAASCLTVVGQEEYCGFQTVGQVSSYASQSEDWIYHETAGLIRAYCINNADDYSVVASSNWSTTLDEHDWDRCGFEFSSLRGDTMLLAATTQPGYSNYYSAWRAVKIDVSTGEIISESQAQQYWDNILVHDPLSDLCLYTSNYSQVKCWSPWTDEILWTLSKNDYPQLTNASNWGPFKSGIAFDFFVLWPNGGPKMLHCRDKITGDLISVEPESFVSLFRISFEDGSDGVVTLNPSEGSFQVFDGALNEVDSGNVNAFDNESEHIAHIQTSDSVWSVIHTLPRNVLSPEGVVLYNDQDYACGVPDYVKIDYRLPDFSLIQVCEFTPNIANAPWEANELHLAGEDILGFNAGPLNDEGGAWFASIASSIPNPDGCQDIDSDGVCDNIDDVIPNSFCGVGTIWDPISQTCIVDESACGWQPDGNGDNLIGVNDLLDLLGVYGDTDYDQDGIWDSADDCVGEYDECGVCNGSGPSIPIIESIEILYDSVYAEPIDEWLVFEVGVDTTYSFTCFEWQCGDPLEYQGYDYETVQIGEQCWFAENLRYTPIESTDFSSSEPRIYKDQGTYDVYGAYYNQPAVQQLQLCPVNWRVPSDGDFTSLFAFLENSNVVGKLKSTGTIEGGDGLWYSPNLGATNETGFTMIPAGFVQPQTGPDAVTVGLRAKFWTTDIASTNDGRYIMYGGSWDWGGQWGAYEWPNEGNSIRCIKD